MKDQSTFLPHDQMLKMKDILPMFNYLGLTANEMALFLGMRPESPYAEKYIANDEQELNHLQLYASQSMDRVITLGITKSSRDQFLDWIKSPNQTFDNITPRSLLLDLTKHELLIHELR
jgi:hypothetical protein